MLNPEQILSVFRETGALMEGHFLLTSGLHSNRYFQCAKVLQYPWHAEELCRNLSERLRDFKPDVVVSPAVGGIIVGQETARHLKVRSLFMERDEGRMTLRRGFEIRPGERVAVIEDVTTTGGSVREVMRAAADAGGRIVAVGALVDRSGGRIDFGVPYASLLRMDVAVFEPDQCPLCKESKPVKPGSRGLK
ncbi:orotate phosphoribosyltransferase [bacterium]|nr:orotate phosphoribosyltransferase [bacterium]